jgi:hypothetical protein
MKPSITGAKMNQDDILSMFRQNAREYQSELPVLNPMIFELARILADSKGRFSKEDFEAFIRMGSVLYKIGDSQFQARRDVSEIMKTSLEPKKDE